MDEQPYGKLKPPYPRETCQAEECGVQLTEETEAYLFTDLDSGKFAVFCGATAAYVETHCADRFKLVML